MNPRYVLDTNICIYLMKHSSPRAAERLADCRVGDVAISAITLAELEYGVVASGERAEQNRAALTALLEDLLVLAFDAASAKAYGPVRWQGRTRTRDALDKLIAAQALAVGAVLVTNNPGDFKDYAGLVVENWAA
ncbi:MAG: type II toxin-antitoxin system VapC family toxin [Deltaproteobacteria bacterium]|nr:type II toxin-antitoxin system VapC family toxin [Deltaproteobacteria bacterium]